MTEEIVLKTIQKVSKRLAKKFTFGHYDQSDIEQEMFIEALKALEVYDPSRPLENFLSVYLSNFFKNFKRNHFYRIDYICSTCNNENELCPICRRYHQRNNAKRSLMEPYDIEQARGIFDSDKVDYTINQIEVKEILELIDQNLEPSFREDYLKMKSGVKITSFRRRTILKRIREIIEDAKT